MKHDTDPAAIEAADIWIISSNADLAARVRTMLESLNASIVAFDAEQTRAKGFPAKRPDALGLVVLDVGHDLESGLEVIHKLRKSRVPAPMIVLTEAFSRDFGAKIISAGVPHFFSHDYCEEDFLAVARSLLKRSGG